MADCRQTANGRRQKTAKAAPMTDAIVTITDRARGILAFEQELLAIDARIEAERARHARVLAEESTRYDLAIEVLRTQQLALEQSIFRLGAN